MLEELETAIEKYQTKWRKLVDARANKAFFESLKPTAVAWKTVDLADFDQRFALLSGECDHIHLGWIDERWIATMHLGKRQLPWGLSVIKLMQRRPGSDDATGLDHIDFYSLAIKDAPDVLENEPKLKWTVETSNPYANWISLWFAKTEAKLRTGTVLDVCIAELEEICEQVI